MEGEVSSGVVLQADGLYVYSEEDIFGEPRVRRRSRPVSKGALLNLEELKPDDVVILPWNISDEVVRSMSFIRGWGGRFVVAVPNLKIS